MLKESCYSLLFCTISSFGWAQQQLMGKIEWKGTTEFRIGVNVVNFSQKKYNLSDTVGNYKIIASPGDTLILSSAGYSPDTLIVSLPLLYEF